MSDLNSQFTRASRNICAKSLTDGAWSAWEAKSYLGSDGALHDFPSGAPAEGAGAMARLEFIDGYFETLLSPKNVAPAGRRMKPKIRADLNKYRPVLIDLVMKQMAEQEGLRKTHEQGEFAYRFPEDAEKLADDLYAFHKAFFHVKDKDEAKKTPEEKKQKKVPKASLSRFATLNDFHTEIEPYLPKYPLLPEERTAAYAAYLKTETPKELEDLLPEGWVATERTVANPDGQIFVRKEGAKLVANLDNGTQVIQLLSEDGSRAFGSPRWCTAYREKETYFDHYSYNLLVVLDPDGSRWQVHFGTLQIMDAMDSAYDLSRLVEEHAGLKEALAPYYLEGRTLFENEELFGDAWSDPSVQEAVLKRAEDNKVKTFLNVAEFASIDLAKKIAADFPDFEFSDDDMEWLSCQNLWDDDQIAGLTPERIVADMLSLDFRFFSGTEDERGHMALRHAFDDPAFCEAFVEKHSDRLDELFRRAAGRGYERLVDEALKQGADVGSENDLGQTGLDLSARWNCPAIFKKILPHCSQEIVEHVNAYGFNILRVPAVKGYLDVVKEIIRSCPQSVLDYSTKDGNIIIDTVVSVNNRGSGVLKTLLPACSPSLLEQPDFKDRTALMLAVILRHKEAVCDLVPYGSNKAVNMVDGEGFSPLTKALHLMRRDISFRKQYAEIALEILKHPGLDLSLVTKTGSTVDELASACEVPEVREAVRRYRIDHPAAVKAVPLRQLSTATPF